MIIKEENNQVTISRADYERLTRNNKAYIDLKHEIEDMFYDEDEKGYDLVDIGEAVSNHFNL